MYCWIYRRRVYQSRSIAQESIFYLSRAQPHCEKNILRTADPTQSTVVGRRHSQRIGMSSPDWELIEYLQIFRYGFSVSTRRAKRLRIRLHSETSKEPCLYLGITPICAKYATVLFFQSARYTARDDRLSNPMKNANQREIRQKKCRRIFCLCRNYSNLFRHRDNNRLHLSSAPHRQTSPLDFAHARTNEYYEERKVHET